MRYSNLSSLAYWFCLPKFRYHNRQLCYENLSTTDFIRLSFRRFESYRYSRIFIQWSVWKVLWNWEVCYLRRYRRYRCPDDGDVRAVAAPAGRHAHVLPHFQRKKMFEVMLSARNASTECHWERQEPLGGGSWPRTPSSTCSSWGTLTTATCTRTNLEKFLHTTICIRGGTIPGLARNGPFLAAPRNGPPRMHMVVWPVICSSCSCSICSVQVLCGSCADAITECVADSWRCTHSSFSTGGSVSVPMTSQNSMNNSTGSSSTAHVSTYRRQLPGFCTT